MHQHPHHRHSRTVSRKLIISTVITLLFFGLELAAGLYANSLSLIGDAFHNLTDAAALMLALLAVMFESRPATASKSFGYQRAGVLAAFVNAGALIAFTSYIFVEAYHRFRTPEAVDSKWMLITSVIAVAMNGGITLWLHGDGKHDLSIRSAVLHMLGDALSSAGIIIAAILIRITGSPIFDPLVSVAIGVLIIWSSWGVLKEAVNLLLEGTPSGIDPTAVLDDLATVPGVHGVHHLHIWALAPAHPALSCHLLLGDVSLREAHDVVSATSELLADKYNIAHTTIQVEYADCLSSELFCRVPTRPGSRG